MIRIGARSITALTGLASSAGVLVASCLVPHSDLQGFSNFYEDHLRQPLFTGLLTVAAFLFSLKTFIIVTMKNNVFGTAEYEKKWQKARKLDPELKRYAALERFALLLFLSILISLTSAVLQFTLGLAGWELGSLACAASAVWAISMIFISLFHLQVNLRSWFDFLNGKS